DADKGTLRPASSPRRRARARSLFFESASRSSLLAAHDLFRKPVSTFRDHALASPERPPWEPLVRALILIAAICSLTAGDAGRQDFYKGKIVPLMAGQPPGGGIDSEMRLVAQFLGRHIPGEPSIVPRNMPGAGGLILGNHLYGVAKPDGLTLGMPGRSGFVLAPIISAADTKYDLRKFTWIGSSARAHIVLLMRLQAHIRSFEGLQSPHPPL